LNLVLTNDDIQAQNFTPQVNKSTSKAQTEVTEEPEGLGVRQRSATMAEVPFGTGVGDAARLSMTVNTTKHKKSFSRHKVNAERMAKRSSAAYSQTVSNRVRPETTASIHVLYA